MRSHRSLWLGLGAVLLIILLLITLPPATTIWTSHLREEVSSQIQAFEEARVAVENDVQRMQAAQRGYLITQQAPFLETYQLAEAQLLVDVTQLHKLAPQVDGTLEQPVNELESRIERWKTEGPTKQLELIRDNNLAAAVAEVSTGQSQKRFDEVLEHLRMMKAEVSRIDANLSANILRVRSLGTALATALGILGVILAGYLIRVFRAMALLAEQLDHERQRAEDAVIAAEEAHAQVQLKLDDMRVRNRQLRVLNRIAGSAGAPLQVEVRAERLMDELVGSLGVEGGAVWRLDNTQRQLELMSKRGHPVAEVAPLLALDDPGLVPQAIITDAPYIVEDFLTEEVGSIQPDGTTPQDTIRSAVALPLHGRSGTIGAVLLVASTAHHFRSTDFDYYVALASQAGLLLENAELYEVVIREQQRLHVVFEQSPEGMIFAEAGSGAIVLANQAARTLMADPLAPGHPLAPETFERLRHTSGVPFTAEDFPLIRALNGEARIGVEVVIEHDDGQRIPVLFNCVPLHDQSGVLSGAVAIFQDLSRFREVERLKSDFVAMVSHELRTPLTAIQGCAQALLRGPIQPDAQRTREFLEIIESQSVRLHELIDNLLNMSQMEAGVLQLRKAPMQPGRLLRSIGRQADEHLKDVRIQVELPPSLPTISADPLRVEQVLLNLLDNARKFSPPGGIITISADVQPSEIVFSVQDQGPGIPEDERERVFVRFFQGAPPTDGPVRGTGLGLAICKALVEAHDGTIWVDPTYHQGARICFSLPLVPAMIEAMPEEIPITATLRAAHDVAHILVVDDEPPMRQMIEGSLRNAGYVVNTVPEGQAALEYLASEQPDLIVLDLMLPGQDGFSVLQQIRDWSQVLVMILTASPEPQKVVRGLQLGADDYLLKPFSMDEFLARVEALLRRGTGAVTPGAPPVVQRGPLLIDFPRRSVHVNGTPIELTPIEFRLLAYLAQHPGQVLTHAQILQHVWGPEYGGENQYLWVHIGRLRQKIEVDPKLPQLIATERGVGYRLAA